MPCTGEASTSPDFWSARTIRRVTMQRLWWWNSFRSTNPITPVDRVVGKALSCVTPTGNVQDSKPIDVMVNEGGKKLISTKFRRSQSLNSLVLAVVLFFLPGVSLSIDLIWGAIFKSLKRHDMYFATASGDATLLHRQEWTETCHHLRCHSGYTYILRRPVAEATSLGSSFPLYIS